MNQLMVNSLLTLDFIIQDIYCKVFICKIFLDLPKLLSPDNYVRQEGHDYNTNP